MPLFISKDPHYSIFSPGTHLSLSGGNVEHRMWCLRGAGQDDGWNRHWGTHRNLYTPFPTPSSGKHHHTPLKHRIYQLFSELTVFSYYFACSAYLDWVTEVLFHSRRSLKTARGWASPGDPGAAQLLSLSSSSRAHALSHACIHPACDLSLRLLTRIHLHTLQYLCALVLVNMPSLWDHTAHQQLLQVLVKICFGEKRIKQNHDQFVALLELVRLFRWK